MKRLKKKRKKLPTAVNGLLSLLPRRADIGTTYGRAEDAGPGVLPEPRTHVPLLLLSSFSSLFYLRGHDKVEEREESGS